MYLFITSSISTDLDLLWALCQKQLSSSGGGVMVTQEHQLWKAPASVQRKFRIWRGPCSLSLPPVSAVLWAGSLTRALRLSLCQGHNMFCHLAITVSLREN